MVDLRKTGRELAGPRPRRGDHHDWPLHRHVLVLAVAQLGDDRLHISGIALGDIVVPHADALPLQPLAELLGGDLAGVACDHDTAHQKPQQLEVADQLQRVVGIGDAEVRAHLLVFDVAGVDGKDDLGLILERLQQAELHVRVVAGKAARGMEVVHQLAAELQIELAELRRTSADLVALLAQVLLVVETKLHDFTPFISSRIFWIFGLQRPQPPPAFVKLVTSSTVVRLFSVMTRRTSFSLTL